MQKEYYASYRVIRSATGDSVGGTCAVVRYHKDLYLVTARHVVDGKYRKPGGNLPGPPEQLTLFGYTDLSFSRTLETVEVDVKISEWKHDQADNDCIVGKIEGYSKPLNYLKIGDLLTRRPFLSEEAQIVGYPEDIKAAGAERHVMVARKGIFATSPDARVHVPNAQGTDYGLIDMYSVNGFSGCPILVHSRNSIEVNQLLKSALPTNVDPNNVGLGIGKPLYLETKVETKLAGLNCGHFKTDFDRVEGHHAGMSYYVHSELIERLICQFTGQAKVDRIMVRRDYSCDANNCWA